MQELKWVSKLCTGGYHGNAGGDVSITNHCKNDESKRRVCITFRKASYVKISAKATYVTFAILGSRIYFKESDKYNGYKFTSFHDNNQICDIKVPYTLIPIETLNIEVGDYNLAYDKDRELYYIDTNLKLSLK